MVHKLRSPFLAIFLACKSISFIRICRTSIVILHEDRSISIQTFSLTKSDNLSALTFQFKTVLPCKVSAEINDIEMVAATIYTLHAYRFPFFHYSNRFMLASFQDAQSTGLTTSERRRGYHFYRIPSTYIIESLANISYFFTGIIVFTAPPVTSQCRRRCTCPLLISQNHVRCTILIINMQFCFQSLVTSIHHFTFGESSIQLINMKDATRNASYQRIGTLQNHRSNIVCRIKYRLFILALSWFQFVFGNWFPI